jgi:predicted nucleic acid-binding protein
VGRFPRTILSSSATSSVVVDASVLIDALLLEDERAAIRLSRCDLHAPVTIVAEFVHGLRRQWLQKRFDDEVGRTALRLFSGNRITPHPVEHLAARMWAIRQNVTAYDAAYVALAESLNLPLITRDRRLANSSGHAARIEYIE